MKKRRFSPFMFAILLFNLSFFVFLVYGVWAFNMGFDWKAPFPAGTQILQKSDTHRGLFRTKGTAVIVAKIPEQHIQAYGNKLRRMDFSSGRPLGLAPDLLTRIEAATDILNAKNTLYTYRDEAVALFEEPFSDWLAVIFDLDTGLLCCLEYDE